jgi:protein-tyrosine-phosphatase
VSCAQSHNSGIYLIRPIYAHSTVATCSKVSAINAPTRVNVLTVKRIPQHNVSIKHKARTITTSDFTKFTYILAADGSNLRHLQDMERRLREQESSSTAEVKLWGSYLPGNKPITDPYYIDTEASTSSCVLGTIFTAMIYRMALRHATIIVSSCRTLFWTKLLTKI